jgi:Flp pilus assembly pilin Flp
MYPVLCCLCVKLAALPTRARREQGQTLAEYGILLGVIAVVVILTALLLGSSISTLFSSISKRV